MAIIPVMHPLRAYRQRHRMTQDVLAAQVGARKATICRIELYRDLPSFALVMRLIEASHHELTADDFLPQHMRTAAGKLEAAE